MEIHDEIVNKPQIFLAEKLEIKKMTDELIQ